MSSGVGFVVGVLAVAAVVVIWLAADASRSRPPTVRPGVVQPVRVQQPLPPVVEAEIVDDGEAARHMNKVRQAHERITDISHRVQEAIIGEALRRANVHAPMDAEHPSPGERHG